jgi:hypothetical protein
MQGVLAAAAAAQPQQQQQLVEDCAGDQECPPLPLLPLLQLQTLRWAALLLPVLLRQQQPSTAARGEAAQAYGAVQQQREGAFPACQQQ